MEADLIDSKDSERMRSGVCVRILVMEALYPRTRCGPRQAAELSKGYQAPSNPRTPSLGPQDDTLNGFESYALDYLLQGPYQKNTQHTEVTCNT